MRDIVAWVGIIITLAIVLNTLRPEVGVTMSGLMYVGDGWRGLSGSDGIGQ